MTVFLTTNKLLNMNSLYAISLVNYNSSLLLKNSPLNSINKIFFLINSKDASYNSALTFNSIASNKFFIDFELIKIKNAV